jgi:hypothetical protein
LGYSYSNTQHTSSPIAVLCSCDAAKYQAELIDLRESTKAAIQKSWAEVEAMQTQCSKYTERIHELEAQFKKCEEEKMVALSRASKMEKDLHIQRRKRPGKGMTRIGSIESFLKLQKVPKEREKSDEIGKSEHSFFSLCSIQNNTQHSLPEALRPTIISDEATSIDYQEEYNLLKLKLSSRDYAIQSLESALELNQSTMKEMSNELLSLESKLERNTITAVESEKEYYVEI